MPILTAPCFVFALGDTLRMSVTYRTRRRPTARRATRSTSRARKSPASSTTRSARRSPSHPGSSLAVTPELGLMDFVIDDTVSATLTPERSTPPFLLAEGFSLPDAGFGRIRFPIRLRARVRDPVSGDIGTIALFAVRLYDPATVDLGSLPVAQAGTVVAAAPDPA